jgi:hypothetical protein
VMRCAAVCVACCGTPSHMQCRLCRPALRSSCTASSCCCLNQSCSDRYGRTPAAAHGPPPTHSLVMHMRAALPCVLSLQV